MLNYCSCMNFYIYVNNVISMRDPDSSITQNSFCVWYVEIIFAVLIHHHHTARSSSFLLQIRLNSILCSVTPFGWKNNRFHDWGEWPYAVVLQNNTLNQWLLTKLQFVIIFLLLSHHIYIHCMQIAFHTRPCYPESSCAFLQLLGAMECTGILNNHWCYSSRGTYGKYWSR